MTLPFSSANEQKPLSSEILLVDEDVGHLADHVKHLSGLAYPVLTASSVSDVLSLPHHSHVLLVVVAGTLHTPVLRAIASYARTRWSAARILILGKAEAALEDHLYDDTVDQRCDPRELVDALLRPREHASSRQAALASQPIRT